MFGLLTELILYTQKPQKLKQITKVLKSLGILPTGNLDGETEPTFINTP